MTIRARITSWAWHARMPLMLLAVLGSISAGAYAVATRQASRRPTFALRAAPRSAQIAPGSSATYRITIRRSHLLAIISLRITGGLPRGAHAQLAPGRTRRSHATLTVSTSKRTRPGNYRLHVAAFTGKLRRTIGLTLKVRAAGGGSTSGTPTTTTTPTSPVTPSAQGVPFTISGNLDNLLPGQPQPLNLSLTNPNSTALSVAGLTVSVQSVSAPHATAALPCTVEDFSVTHPRPPVRVVDADHSGASLAQPCWGKSQTPTICERVAEISTTDHRKPLLGRRHRRLRERPPSPNRQAMPPCERCACATPWTVRVS
jgi:hypothetical protein